MVCKWQIFWRPVFPARHVQHISDLHSKFAQRPHHVSMVDIQCATAEIRRGKKKEEEQETTGQKYNIRTCYAGRP